MLPTLGPEIPGMEVAARYIPTGGGLQVGGDWYDMIPLPGGGRFALVIGDVQGHDVRAAGLMGQLRIALRAYASEGHRPDAVLSRASRFLHGITRLRRTSTAGADLRFATCLYVEVDPATGVLEIARAGHPDPAIRMARRHGTDPPDRGRAAPGHRPGRRLPHHPPRPGTRRDDAAVHRRPDRDRRPRPGHRLAAHPDDPGGTQGGHQAEDLEELADALVQAVHGPSSHHTTGPLADRREDDIALLLLSRPGDASPTAHRHRRHAPPSGAPC